MEFIDGQTVDEWLRAAPRTWQQVLDVFVAAGRGLAAAHAAGIIHRDFKPQNVMIGRDGGVRVTDFGLARLIHEDGAVAPGVALEHPRPRADTATKTGALLGTPAYMSPEQSRGSAIDARSDQFSFSVALHEALFGGTRPDNTPTDMRRANVPNWLRSIVLRGATVDREQRYGSMTTLLAALQRGRTRLRRRAWAFGAVLAASVFATSGWRVARGERVDCSIPEARVGAAWAAGNADNPRRRAIHAAFLASGRQSAETSWQRLSATLDEYVGTWNAMYRQACEATHLHGEQSSEVLDLRMSCLNDNLDQVRALTDTLLSADGEVVGHAMTAAKDLTPVARCGDVALLRSAVPLPRDERTLREVQRLRRSLAELEALIDVGRVQEALVKAIALRREVDATGYKPLLGQLLFTTGTVQAGLFDKDAETTLESAVLTAVAARDDLTAAKASTDLIYVLSLTPRRHHDSERWYRVANAILDRVGEEDRRTRAWALQNYGGLLNMQGKPERSMPLLQQALALKQQSLGDDHLDVAISLAALADVLVQLDRAPEALSLIDRAVEIYTSNVEADSIRSVNPLNLRADVLRILGRRSEAREVFNRVLRIANAGPHREHPIFGDTAAGLGQLELAEGRPAVAIPLLEKALATYEECSAENSVFGTNVRFALARALWQGGGNRHRAVSLAIQAQATYVSQRRAHRANEIAEWLRGCPRSRPNGKRSSEL